MVPVPEGCSSARQNPSWKERLVSASDRDSRGSESVPLCQNLLSSSC